MQPLEGAVLELGEGGEDGIVLPSFEAGVWEGEVMCLMALASCMGVGSTLNALGMMIIGTKAQVMKTKTGIVVQKSLFKFY